MKKIIFLFIIALATFQLNAQVNQFDTNGKRHGKWMKKFKNGNLRYQGEFNHGKEIGIFKYYSLKSKNNPSIIKTFNENDHIALVKFFKPNGKLMSEGKMDNKKRIGKWVYYQNDGKTILQEENYVNGKLDGEYKTYFENNKPTIIAHYKNGLLDGSYKRYEYKGFIYQDLTYKNGVLNGLCTYYDRLTGKISKKGSYINDKKTGLWELYFDGEFVDTRDYSKINLKK